jgi:hypothetical protein
MRKQSAKGQPRKGRIPTERGARLKKIAQTYLDGLAKRDLSAIPYDEKVVLHAPLGPGGAANPIKGKAAMLDYFNGILHLLGEVKVLEGYINEQMTKICTEAEIEIIGSKAMLRLVDRLTVNKAGKITAQESYYDPRPALPPSWRAEPPPTTAESRP